MLYTRTVHTSQISSLSPLLVVVVCLRCFHLAKPNSLVPFRLVPREGVSPTAEGQGIGPAGGRTWHSKPILNRRAFDWGCLRTDGNGTDARYVYAGMMLKPIVSGNGGCRDARRT